MNCSPPAIGPPTPSLKGRSSCLSRPPCLVSTSPVRTITTRRDDPLRLALGRLPVDRYLGGEALAGRGFLVEDLGAAVAVVADRGLADEDARLAGRGLDSLEQVAGSCQAALADPDLGLIREPLVDLLADQVDDAVHALRAPPAAAAPWSPARRASGRSGSSALLDRGRGSARRPRRPARAGRRRGPTRSVQTLR